MLHYRDHEFDGEVEDSCIALGLHLMGVLSVLEQNRGQEMEKGGQEEHCREAQEDSLMLGPDRLSRRTVGRSQPLIGPAVEGTPFLRL